MVKTTLLPSILAMFLALLGINARAANPVASIDRSVISVEDTLTLTVHIDGTGSFSGPDTSPLDKDFQVLGTSESSRHSYINGQSSSSTDWNISLQPRHTGTLRIPPLAVDGGTTQALSVQVNPATTHSANNGDPVFVESEVDHRKVYVQQQIIFTVRVYQSIQLDNLSLSNFDIDNAQIKRLSQNTFQRRLNNQIYRVHEIRYAIFPQQSGTITIPEVVFNANEVDNQGGFFNLPGQGRPIRRITKQHDITVLDPPASFTPQADNPWLPAQNLQLVESWSSNPNHLRVGDSVTRTVTLKARGLLGSQLPPHTFKKIPGAQLYPDKGSAKNSLTEQGASSVRTDSEAIIPTRKGTLEIPPITVTWWDTNKHTLRKATLAARTITVQPAPAGSQSNSQPLAIDHSEPVALGGAAAAQTNRSSSLWQLTTLIFALLWLATLWLWWSARRSATVYASARPPAREKAPTEKQRFKQLLNTCQSGDLQAVRDAIIRWGQAFWADKAIHSLTDIQQHCNHPALAKALAQLDSSLYGSDTAGENRQPIDGLISLLKITRTREPGHAKDETNGQLPPLYQVGAK